MISKTISHYKILEKLGEGGMGVVYKAQDTKLDRLVALKFLPQQITVSDGDKARFLQEAKAASAVMHPNVCVIYDIQEEDNQQFIVMEYVEGKTLTQMVPVQKFQDAIGYAIQIDEALQEAHGKGVIHRDVKTDNIMVNTKNQIKVMDFGLAKLKGSLKLTKTSSTVGTLSYMAPEQIQGGEVDARSDIFSFGVVLYEMLTGHLPFRGEHEAAMVYSIVNEEPEPVQKYRPEVSSELIHILNRALEKDPEDRYQTVHDMVIDLRRVKKETSKVSRLTPKAKHLDGEDESAKVATNKIFYPYKIRLAIILLSLFALVCAGLTILLIGRRPKLNPGMKFHYLQTPFRDIGFADMSLDGNWIVFTATDDRGKFDIYMMNVTKGEWRRITNDSANSISGPSISPDAGTIIYARPRRDSGNMEIVSVSSLTGKGRIIIENGWGPRWLPDGQRICYVVFSTPSKNRRTDECWTSKPDGSDRRLEFADTVKVRLGLRIAFVFSLDGKSVAWPKNFPEGYSEIMIRDLKKGTDKQLTFDKNFADDPLWSPTGHIIYSSKKGGNINLWVIPSSGGKSVQLTKGSGPDTQLSITADGKRLFYFESQKVGYIKIANLIDGTVKQLTIDDRFRVSPSISPSGKYIAFSAQESGAMGPMMNIYRMNIEGGNFQKLTDDPYYKDMPAWSPDEKWITYSAFLSTEPPDSSRVFLIQADNPGKPKIIGKGYIDSHWINEKEFIVFNQRSWSTYKGSIDRSDLVKFSEDSIFAYPILYEKYIIMLDHHKRHEGWYITTADMYRTSGIKNSRKLLKDVASFLCATSIREMFYVTSSDELHRVSLPDGEDRLVKKKFPGLSNGFTVSSDGKEIVYTENYSKTRFATIENLFK